jgi:hypothetical protein
MTCSSSGSKPVVDLAIQTEGCSYDDIKAMLYFLYNDTLPSIDSEESIPYDPSHLLALADEMTLERLKNMMELEIARVYFTEAGSWLGFFNEQEAIRKVEEWIEVYVLSCRYAASNLRKFTLYHIIQAAYFAKPLVSGMGIIVLNRVRNIKWVLKLFLF